MFRRQVERVLSHQESCPRYQHSMQNPGPAPGFLLLPELTLALHPHCFGKLKSRQTMARHQPMPTRSGLAYVAARIALCIFLARADTNQLIGGADRILGAGPCGPLPGQPRRFA